MILIDFLTKKRCHRCMADLKWIEQEKQMVSDAEERIREASKKEKELLGLRIEIDNKSSDLEAKRLHLKEQDLIIGAEWIAIKEQKNNLIKAKEDMGSLEEKHRRLLEAQSLMAAEREVIRDRERMFDQRESLIEDGKKFIAEKEVLLSKREAALWSEKEKMIGQDSAEIKRSIILPSLQQKWDAEKKKLDAERIKILESTPKVWESLDSRKMELEKIIAGIKSKPMNSGNHILLVENEGKLKQLMDVISLVDSVKGDLHVV